MPSVVVGVLYLQLLVDLLPEPTDVVLARAAGSNHAGSSSRHPEGQPIIPCLRPQRHPEEEVAVFTAAHIATSATVDC